MGWDMSIIIDINGVKGCCWRVVFSGLSVTWVFWLLFRMVLIGLLSELLWICFGGCRLMFWILWVCSIALGLTAQQNPIVLDPATQPDPTTFRRKLGSNSPAKPNSIGSGYPTRFNSLWKKTYVCLQSHTQYSWVGLPN